MLFRSTLLDICCHINYQFGFVLGFWYLGQAYATIGLLEGTHIFGSGLGYGSGFICLSPSKHGLHSLHKQNVHNMLHKLCLVGPHWNTSHISHCCPHETHGDHTQTQKTQGDHTQPHETHGDHTPSLETQEDRKISNETHGDHTQPQEKHGDPRL